MEVVVGVGAGLVGMRMGMKGQMGGESRVGIDYLLGIMCWDVFGEMATSISFLIILSLFSSPSGFVVHHFPFHSTGFAPQKESSYYTDNIFEVRINCFRRSQHDIAYESIIFEQARHDF